jgi:hypothetical protein
MIERNHPLEESLADSFGILGTASSAARSVARSAVNSASYESDCRHKCKQYSSDEYISIPRHASYLES